MQFFAFFLGSVKNKPYLCTEKIRKDTKMDNRFTPRSNEEMLAAVRAFQARQRQWYEESDERLEKRIIEHELAV
jgi:hypothetical protein